MSDFVGEQSRVHIMPISAKWKHKSSIHIGFIVFNGGVTTFFAKSVQLAFRILPCVYPYSYRWINRSLACPWTLLKGGYWALPCQVPFPIYYLRSREKTLHMQCLLSLAETILTWPRTKKNVSERYLKTLSILIQVLNFFGLKPLLNSLLIKLQLNSGNKLQWNQNPNTFSVTKMYMKMSATCWPSCSRFTLLTTASHTILECTSYNWNKLPSIL